MTDPKDQSADKPADDTKPTTDAIDSSANVSAEQEEKAAPDAAKNSVGRKVIFNANGMKLEGKISESLPSGGAKINVDGTEYEATGYGFGKSEFYGVNDTIPDEYKANANAR